MDSQWLKSQFRMMPDRTKADLARALGLEPSAISKILNDARQIKAQEYHKMRRFFGLPTDGEKAVAPHNGNASCVIQPLAADTGLQEGFSGPQDGDWVLPADILSRQTKSSPESIRIFNVDDTMMEPDYRRGEPVLVDIAAKSPTPPGAFIVSDGFGYMLRYCEFIPHSTPPSVKISARNPGFEPQTLELDQFHLIGRVIAKLQWT
ncbi:MAG: hypothetical protein IT559_07575 [Alphaproteobacteria bacterium]|nr:hypothetical protein [Alphaproteobacteria bacterium]